MSKKNILIAKKKVLLDFLTAFYKEIAEIDFLDFFPRMSGFNFFPLLTKNICHKHNQKKISEVPFHETEIAYIRAV